MYEVRSTKYQVYLSALCYEILVLYEPHFLIQHWAFSVKKKYQVVSIK